MDGFLSIRRSLVSVFKVEEDLQRTWREGKVV
jgi:hypothetical protein